MTTRTLTCAVCAVAATAALALGACGTARPPPEAPPVASAPSGPPASAPSSTATDPDPEDDMRISITVGGEQFTADLDDSAAGRDLLAQLPITLEMRDHGSVEKTGRLPSSLSLEGQPDGADPDVGDLGYYAPGQDLVLYYGDEGYFDGIVVLGRMDDTAASRLSGIRGTVTVRVERVSD